MRLKFWRHKLKSYLLDEKYKVTEAFTLNGKRYLHFDDAFNFPVNRAMAATWIFEELRMRVDRAYLEKHTRAMDILLNPANKKLNIGAIALLNQNLKERLELAPFPDHIFKLASVEYFDESESPYSYDPRYNEEKIKIWKASGEAEMLDFFSKRLIPDLLPSLRQSGIDVPTFIQLMETQNQIHLKHLQALQSNVN